MGDAEEVFSMDVKAREGTKISIELYFVSIQQDDNAFPSQIGCFVVRRVGFRRFENREKDIFEFRLSFCS